MGNHKLRTLQNERLFAILKWNERFEKQTGNLGRYAITLAFIVTPSRLYEKKRYCSS